MCQPLVWRGEASLVLDGIELRDPVERRLGDGRFRRLPHVEDAPAAMAPAGDLGDRRPRREPRAGLARRVQRCEPAIGIGLQKPGEVREMGRRVRAATVGAVEVDRRRRCGAAERPVVTDIDP